MFLRGCRYRTIVKLRDRGAERLCSAFVAAMTRVQRPGLSFLEAEIRPWKAIVLTPL